MARRSWADFGIELSDEQRGAAFAGLLQGVDVDERGRLIAAFPSQGASDEEISPSEACSIWRSRVELWREKGGDARGLSVGVTFESNDELSLDERRRIVELIARAEGVAAAHLVGAGVSSEQSLSLPPKLGILVGDEPLARDLDGLEGAESVRVGQGADVAAKVDLLSFSGSLSEALEVVKGESSAPRAKAVLVLGGLGDGEAVALSEELRERVGADAIVALAVPGTEQRRYVEELLRELGHELELDVAVTRAARSLGLEPPWLCAAKGGFALVPCAVSREPAVEPVPPWASKFVPAFVQRHWVLLTTFAIAALAAFLRSYRLSNHLGGDGKLWIARTEVFWRGLAEGNFAATYAKPHPGVTYMWLHGIFVKWLGASAEVVDRSLIIAAKLPAIVMGTFSTAVTFPLLLAIFGRRNWQLPLLVSLLWCTEPFLVLQSRVAHLDMVALGFTWVGMLCLALAYRRERALFAVLAGLSFGLGCLTKFSMVALSGTALGLLGLVFLFSRFKNVWAFKVCLFAGLALVGAVFLFWPALWADPVGTVQLVLDGTVDEMGDRAHGPNFYAYFLSKTTPYETLLLAVLGVAFLVIDWRNKAVPAWLVASIIPYAVIIFLTPKQLSRYVLPLYAGATMLAAVAAMGLVQRWLHRYRLPAAYGALGLAALFAVRFDRALEVGPVGRLCTSWPWATCVPWLDDSNNRQIANTIRKDWRKRKATGEIKIYANKQGLLNDHIQAKWVKRRRYADYVVYWGSDAKQTIPGGELLKVFREGELTVGALYRMDPEPKKEKKKEKGKEKGRRAGKASVRERERTEVQR